MKLYTLTRLAEKSGRASRTIKKYTPEMLKQGHIIEISGGKPRYLESSLEYLKTIPETRGRKKNMGKPIREFIKEHRQELDECIKRACPNNQYFNDEERRQWILNDEGLYNWARSEGVRI